MVNCKLFGLGLCTYLCRGELTLLKHYFGRSPGLVVMGRDSCSEGFRFESQHHILD